MKNIKTIKVNIPNEKVLGMVNNTPSMQNLMRSKLIVGDNIENVNHVVYSHIMRLFPLIGITIVEIK